ncbi:MAG TPA: prepilin-type N-terminal cleavage/methylation domain-containing protein [Verrucomicrobiae bacterium]|nr:prepilin-type N-terminal cleavage/methylation domain-containing protein [Verrucomicrobiae bacterium]
MRLRGTIARQGFTLVEVLLAVMILSLVVTAVYSTWSAALSAWRRGSDASEVFQRQRIVMESLTELAESVVYYGASPGLYAITGTSKPDWGDTVSFVTASDVLLPPSEAIDAGMRRVTISMEQDDYGRKYLAIVNEPAVSEDETNITATLQAHVLSMDVSGFYVRYLDPRDNAWYNKWDENSLIPLAMEFTVVFGEQGDRLPPVVVTRAVDLPTAPFIGESTGLPLNAGSTSQVERQDTNTLDQARQNNTSQSSPSVASPIPLPGRM